MEFFDCNVFYGLPAKRPLAPVPTVEALLTEMDRAGVSKALVWHIAQHDASPRLGNQAVTEALRDHPRLVGCWTVLPNQTREFPPPRVLFQRMQAARVGALRVFPNAHRFLVNAVSMGDLLTPMVTHRIPLFVSVKRGMEWRDVYALLADFPDLVCVICDHGCWGMDRMFRPLLERYPNVYVDTSQYMLDGGLEALVADYGARRILFGSGFPASYFGGMMLTLKHAEIPQEAKAAIAGGNLERLLEEAAL
jgi:predicted TIM-barrel fold metal-dependent hydrolase